MMYIFFRIGRKLRDYHISLVLLTTHFNHSGKLTWGCACSSVKCVLHVLNIGFSLQYNIKQGVVVHFYPNTQGVESGSQKLKVILGCYMVNLRPVCDAQDSLQKRRKKNVLTLSPTQRSTSFHFLCAGIKGTSLPSHPVQGWVLLLLLFVICLVFLRQGHYKSWLS